MPFMLREGKRGRSRTLSVKGREGREGRGQVTDMKVADGHRYTRLLVDRFTFILISN